jgi:tRNA(Ile)-lysidine synthase
VALLALLRSRGDLRLHAAHLNHQTRGEENAADSRFVANLAAGWGIPCTLGNRDEVERGLRDLPRNPSARFRAARLAFFRRIVTEQHLLGVLLAHHADDQAETVLLRLLRGSGYEGLAGMAERTDIGGLTVRRPLLSVHRADLRAYLASIGQTWREDSSNDSDKYARNRARKWLADRPEVTAALLEVANACRRLKRWVRANAPPLEEEFPVHRLGELPMLLARASARRWLIERGVNPAALSHPVLDRLTEMATDAASPSRTAFPGNLIVRRRGGRMIAITDAGKQDRER